MTEDRIVINFNLPVNDEGVGYLFTIFNSFESEEQFEIYINSGDNGGLVYTVPILKREFEKRRPRLILTGINHATSLMLFFMTNNCEKEILPLSTGVYQRPAIHAMVNPSSKHVITPEDKEFSLYQVADKFCDWFERKFLYLTKEEQKTVKDGGIVYFSDTKMTELFDKNYIPPEI